MRRLLVALALGLAVAGCGTMFTAPGTIPVNQSLSPEAQAAQNAINEGNVLVAASANVLTQNLVDGIVTLEEARAQHAQLRTLATDLDRARDLLEGGEILAAKDRAELTRRLVVALHKEIAARARRTP